MSFKRVVIHCIRPRKLGQSASDRLESMMSIDGIIFSRHSIDVIGRFFHSPIMQSAFDKKIVTILQCWPADHRFSSDDEEGQLQRVLEDAYVSFCFRENYNINYPPSASSSRPAALS
jgi:hypothetical protein